MKNTHDIYVHLQEEYFLTKLQHKRILTYV